MASAAWATPPQEILDREAALGLTRSDNGDGTFSYVPPSGLSYADQVGNHFTWHYVGAAVYSDDPQPIAGSTEYYDGTDTPDDPTEGVGSLLGATKTDVYGRVWEITAIDTPAMEAAISNYFTVANTEAGVEPVPQGPAHPQTADDGVGTITCWPNASWDARDCDGDPLTNDMLIYGTDDRVGFSSPVTHTESSLLHVRVTNFGDCSGVKISDRHVITAAHCVTDTSGNLLPDLTVDVCSNQTTPLYNCVGFEVDGSDIVIAPGWSMGATLEISEAKRDWAILTMPSGLPDPKMYLADPSIGRTELTRMSPQRVGHDAYKPQGTSLCAPVGYQLRAPAAAVTGTGRGLIRTNGDASVRGSGGPYFHVPSGLTAGRVLGLHTFSSHGVNSFNGGPRVTEFRKAAVALIEV